MLRTEVARDATSLQLTTVTGDEEERRLPKESRCSGSERASEALCTAEILSAAGETALVRQEQCSGGDRRWRSAKGKELWARERL
jgi:hypothetical protein